MLDDPAGPRGRHPRPAARRGLHGRARSVPAASRHGRRTACGSRRRVVGERRRRVRRAASRRRRGRRRRRSRPPSRTPRGDRASRGPLALAERRLAGWRRPARAPSPRGRCARPRTAARARRVAPRVDAHAATSEQTRTGGRARARASARHRLTIRVSRDVVRHGGIRRRVRGSRRAGRSGPGGGRVRRRRGGATPTPGPPRRAAASGAADRGRRRRAATGRGLGRRHAATRAAAGAESGRPGRARVRRARRGGRPRSRSPDHADQPTAAAVSAPRRRPPRPDARAPRARAARPAAARRPAESAAGAWFEITADATLARSMASTRARAARGAPARRQRRRGRRRRRHAEALRGRLGSPRAIHAAHRLALVGDLGAEHLVEVRRHVLVRGRPRRSRAPPARARRRTPPRSGSAASRSRSSALSRTTSSLGGHRRSASRAAGIGSLSTLLSVSASPSPLKSRRPSSASHSTTPGREDVGAPVDVLGAPRLLGRHVRELALELPGARRRELLVARATPKSVSRALPSMPTRMFCGETSRCTMPSGLPSSSVSSCAACSPASTSTMMRARHVHRERAVRPAPSAGDEAREGVALHVLHDEVVALVARPDLEDGDDVRVVDPRGEPRLVEEHLDELGLAREVRVQALDGDEPLKAARAREAPEVHGRHPAGRELGDQLEAVEPPALAFDGNELAAQDFGSRAKVMATIMTPRGAQNAPASPRLPDPSTRNRRSACGPAQGAPRLRSRARPLGEEEADDRRWRPPRPLVTPRSDVRPDLGARPCCREAVQAAL